MAGEIRALSERTGRKIRVGIDISSMNRTMAASLLLSVLSKASCCEAITLFYVPARFASPSLTVSPIEQVGPVLPELSGFKCEPGRPVAVVMGLGYEYGTAVGLINQLEPQLTICLKASGGDPMYDAAVSDANLGFDFGPYNVEVSDYDLRDIGAAFRHIETLVHGLVPTYRVVLVPMGPKILSAILVLIALKYFGRAALWRVARSSPPADVQADSFYVSADVDLDDVAIEKLNAAMGPFRR
ncbi:hypothetical protein DFR24_4010 [Panacagrimonas perspica]|uniref:Uncharacterized protein n=1 Tax=Panacagrimonas perspica TaxID=381431 RepID=A0A4R7NXI8_9GAMM|nr:hypothetical protein DFR24_4010 [Panacagrimonas perspica]